MAQHAQDFEAALARFDVMESARNTYFDVSAELMRVIGEVEEIADQTVEGKAADIEDIVFRSHLAILGVTLLVTALAFVSGFLIIRSILGQLGADPNRLLSITRAIAAGNLDVDMQAGNKPAHGVLAGMSAMRDTLREQIVTDRERAATNGRVRRALDTVSANVMIADTDYRIIYQNDGVRALLKDIEGDLRTVLPQFRADKVEGANMDVFHKNPAHQRNMLDKLTSSYSGEFQFGERHIRLVANPVQDDNGERIGTVLQWVDRTAEVATENEIQSIVEKALAGDLSERIELIGKDGFFGSLSQGVNELVDVAERVINDTVVVLGAMANGDLTRSIESDYAGTFGQLKANANTTLAKLTEVLSEINESAGTVMSGSKEIALGNTDLSKRTEEQASSLEETASSMEEMTSTVRQNADNAKEADQLALATRQQAEKGGAVVNNAVTAMGEITESSNKISDIIGVIDEIAFQTNLLALNAAVEAARAGEQGRGFAVVASEVRNLAGRSAIAAKEIKDLIKDSVLKVEEGAKLVDESGQTLSEIMDSVKKVSDIIAAIARASEEQSIGIEQVNKAISHMDEMTQQNAALVEEAAAASESMGGQARSLSDLVSFFKTTKATVSSAPVSAPAPVPSAVSHSAPARDTSPAFERRSASRPWSPPPAAEQSAPPQPVQKVSGSDVDDSDWTEF